MSDFLTRLVATAYGAAPVMQPRPVAQFEPLTPPLAVGLQGIDATPLTPPEITDQAASATQPAGAPAATMAPTTTAAAMTPRPTALVNPIVRPAQSASPDHAAPPSAATMSQPGLSLQDRRAAQTLDAARGGVRLADAANASMDPPREQGSAAAPLQASPQHAVTWQPAASPVTTPTSPLPYVQAPQRTPEALQARTAPSLAPPHAERGMTDLPALPASSARQTAPAAPVAPRAAFAARVAAEHPAQRARGGPPAPLQPPSVISSDSETAPAPIIRVTIGRIVIKAEPARTTLSTAAPAHQPVAPKLSLDQYLQGRDGGGK